MDAFQTNLTFARTVWDRPNTTLSTSWTSTLSNNLINEATFTYSHDYVYINVFTADGAYQRSNYGINYPYIFQENRKSSTRCRRSTCRASSRSTAVRIRRISDGPIYNWTDSSPSSRAATRSRPA